VAPNGRVTFTINARVDPNFHGDFDITNIATLTLGPNTRCEPTNPGQPCAASAVFHVPVPAAPPPAPPTQPPPLASTGVAPRPDLQLALLLILAGVASLYFGRRRKSGSQ
jgi:hypothetical protein